jgi:hypothetical protein
VFLVHVHLYAPLSSVYVLFHQYITVHHDAEPVMIVGQHTKKLPAVIIVNKDITTLIAARSHMV